MTFNNNFHGIVSSLVSMDIFSNLLSSAVSANGSIQHGQTKDSLEKWGVSSTNHDYCYGRHLYYTSQTAGIVPFWIGLDITGSATFVNLTFDRVTLKTLAPANKVADLSPANCSELPSYCNPQNNVLIERRLKDSEFKNLCKRHDPKILSDFLNEVLGAV